MVNNNKNSQIFYPLAADNWGKEELLAIREVVDSNLFTMGKKVIKFESEVALKFNSKHAVMVNSGSSANLIMLTALKILLTQERTWPKTPNIIVPAVSWSTTYTPAYYLGYKLKFCDVDSNHFGLNRKSVLSAIDKDTVAILAVNLLGSPADLEGLKQLAEEKNLILLEDNCESLGATLNDKFTGTFGLMASQSSFFSHHINSMEGGWITTDSQDLADIIISLRAHGWTRQLRSESSLREKSTSSDWFDSQFEFVLPGLNFRPLEIEAAIASVQLTKVESMLNYRRQNAEHFRDLVEDINNVRTQVPNGESSWFAFPLLFDSKNSRDLIANKFREFHIECRPIVTGNFTRQPTLKYLDYEISEELTVSDQIHDNGLYIGNHPHDLSKELKTVARILRDHL